MVKNKTIFCSSGVAKELCDQQLITKYRKHIDIRNYAIEQKWTITKSTDVCPKCSEFINTQIDALRKRGYH